MGAAKGGPAIPTGLGAGVRDLRDPELIGPRVGEPPLRHVLLVRAVAAVDDPLPSDAPVGLTAGLTLVADDERHLELPGRDGGAGGVTALVVRDWRRRRVVLGVDVREVLAQEVAVERGRVGVRRRRAVVYGVAHLKRVYGAGRGAARQAAVEHGVEVEDGDVVLLRVLVD